MKSLSRMTKVFQGTVVSAHMDKTIVVEIVTLKSHPLYRKKYTSRKRFKVHDPKKEAKAGDRVMIRAVAPISKEKRFALDKILPR